MPPFYDIYGLSKSRDSKTIESYLNFYCYRDMIENFNGLGIEIAIYKNDKYDVKEDFVPVDTLSDVINYGLNHPNVGFAFYIGDKEKYKRDINGVILKFTYDGKIIFGISIEKNMVNKNNLIDNFDMALDIQHEIMELTNSKKTLIGIEHAPSDDEDEFDKDMEYWSSIRKQNK